MTIIKYKFAWIIFEFLLSISSFRYVCSVSSSSISMDHTGNEYLDSSEKFLLSWRIKKDHDTIYFEVTAETKGFVGFGLSPNGGMSGAEMLIAGVNPDGRIYSKGYRGIGNTFPAEDSHSGWIVTEATETEKYTKLSFHRRLTTCHSGDRDDPIQITDGTIRLIWAMGETDDILYHGTNRGTKSVNFYMNDDANFDPEKYEKLDLLLNIEMPAQHTSYWCSIHRAPIFYEKQHVIAFDAVLENEHAIRHTHHFMMYSCRVPDDKDPEVIFEPWVTYPGEHCYGAKKNTTLFPFSKYCHSNVIYVWSKGGKRLVFPENLGLSIPTQLYGRREYYALEIHYDNPEEISGLRFQTGGRMYYTSDLRDAEVGIMLVDHTVSPQLTIPPQTTNFVVSGHCSSECTEKYLPKDGITIFNNLFHAHLAGRKLKLRHFRGNQELPWVDVDEYYDFDFQQNKPLDKPRKVLRGDQLTVECTFDSTTAEEGKSIVGGLGTREEMCESIFYYYPRQPWFFCESEQDINEHFKLFGITQYTKKDAYLSGGFPEYEILEPPHLAGDYRESVSFKVNWKESFRMAYQHEKLYGVQTGLCGNGIDMYRGMTVKYPDNLKEYVPPSACQQRRQVGQSVLPGDHPIENAAVRLLLSDNLIKVVLLIAIVVYY